MELPMTAELASLRVPILLARLPNLPPPAFTRREEITLATRDNFRNAPRYGIYYNRYLRKIKAGPLLAVSIRESGYTFFTNTGITDNNFNDMAKTESAPLNAIFLWCRRRSWRSLRRW